MDAWQPSRDWLARHDSADLVYRVRLRWQSAAALDAAWRALQRGRTLDRGDILMGGAALTRVGPTLVDVTSGGEDALDSLPDAVARVKDAAGVLGVPEPVVVAEERAVWSPDAG